MLTKEKALELHRQGCNCAQAVLCSVCSQYGLDQDTAFALTTFFGKGMRRGEVCGAVTGALMALGLKHGTEDSRRSLDSLKFMNEFSQKFGSCICREIIGPEGTKKAELCPSLIAFASEYLEKEANKE